MCLECRVPVVSRRRFLTMGAAALTACAAIPSALALSPTPAPNAITPDEALKRIMDGNARYVANAISAKDFEQKRAALATAQYPIAAIVSCADSRVAPEYAFDQGPGELFIVRVAGNFVNDDGLASIEYGAKYLGTPLVMVLGHTRCGAVDAAIKVLKDHVELPGHLPELVNSIKPAVEAAARKNPSDLLAEATAENVRFNVAKLTSSEAVLGGLIRAGKLKVVGGVYDLSTGRVNLL